jgi:hypothetical protein
VKSNASFSKPPTKTTQTQTQTNHVILSILAYVKLEWLKLRNQLNFFAFKAKKLRLCLRGCYEQRNELPTPLSTRYSCDEVIA